MAQRYCPFTAQTRPGLHGPAEVALSQLTFMPGTNEEARVNTAAALPLSLSQEADNVRALQSSRIDEMLGLYSGRPARYFMTSLSCHHG